MTDIALALVQDPETGLLGFDLVMDGPDLMIDDGIETGLIVSAFSNHLAAADDLLPGDTSDRQGWWGDAPLDAQGKPDLIGSRLWLLGRGKHDSKTASLAKFYAREALRWMIDDGVAQSVDVRTEWSAADRLDLFVTISQRGPQGQIVTLKYQYEWNVTLNGAEAQAIGSSLPSDLLREGGGLLLTEDGRPILLR